MSFDIGGFRAVEPIAAGGSAQVWLGIRIASGGRVAMKVFPVDQLDAARREAALAAAVDHPHLVRVLDVVADTDRAVLVTEYAAGGDLSDLLERRGRLSAGETLTVLLPLAATLATAHERGIVHGDLSAANVVFDRAGRPLLADLGAARAAAESGRPVFATPVDAAPELARGGSPTPAADMFSLGSLAMACLTGRHAWPADDLRDVLIQAAAGQWPDPGDDAAPDGLVSLIRGLLEHDPERRPAAASLVIALKAAGRPEPLDLRAEAVEPAVSSPISPPMPAVTGRPDRTNDGPAGAGRLHGDRPDPLLHPPGRIGTGRTGSGAGTTRGRDPARGRAQERDREDEERRVRSRAVTRRRADAVPTAEQTSVRPRGAHGLRRVRTQDGRRPRLPARFVRVALQVVVCLVVIGVAGAAGLWWAGWGRSEPAAVVDAASAGPSSGVVVVPVEPAQPDVPSRIAAAPSAPSAATPTPAGAPTRPSVPTVPPTDRSVPPPAGRSVPPPVGTSAQADDWSATIRSLDDARARALVRRDASLLDFVYTRDSTARTADAGTIGTMLADGLRVSGAVHVTRTVRILGRGPIRLAVEDSLPSYSILDATGRVVGRTAARAAAPRVVVLVPTSGGYRISQVQSA